MPNYPEYPFNPSFDRSKKGGVTPPAELVRAVAENMPGPSQQIIGMPDRLSGQRKFNHRGVAYLRLVHGFGSRVASLDDGNCYPWIDGAVYVRGRDLPFEEFLSQVKATCQGNSGKVPADDEAAAGADLVVTNATPMVGAIVTLELPEGRGKGGCPTLTVRFVINGANVDTTVHLEPAGVQPQSVYRRQFLIMAAVDNAGEASVALATSCVVTLAQTDLWHVPEDLVGPPAPLPGTTLTVMPFNLRDFDR
jgi:hypothetical protein